MQSQLLRGQFNGALLECMAGAWELALEVLAERRQGDLHALMPPCKALATLGGPAFQLATQARIQFTSNMKGD